MQTSSGDGNLSVPNDGSARPNSAPALAKQAHASSDSSTVPDTRGQAFASTAKPSLATPSPSTLMATAASNDHFEDYPIGDGDMDAWGAMEEMIDEDDDNQGVSEVPAQVTGTPSSAATARKEPTNPFVAYDDSEKPDFAGWLAAQTQSKAKKALPKGLSKKTETSSARPNLSGRAATTGTLSSSTSTAKAKPASSTAATTTTTKPGAPVTTSASAIHTDDLGDSINLWLAEDDNEDADNNDGFDWGAEVFGGSGTAKGSAQPRTTKDKDMVKAKPRDSLLDTDKNDNNNNNNNNVDDDDDDEGGWGNAWT